MNENGRILFGVTREMPVDSELEKRWYSVCYDALTSVFRYNIDSWNVSWWFDVQIQVFR